VIGGTERSNERLGRPVEPREDEAWPREQCAALAAMGPASASPLLANVYLNALDRAWEEGHGGLV
ncbi:MAG: hypothetical protein LC777_15300, partial [Actinobacteria bacterium]|nr:hypothetical protein [Actinomycetota bacterium]